MHAVTIHLLCLCLCGLTLAPFARATSVPGAALNDREQGIIPIAAFTASGDLERLKPALADGLAKGLTVNEIKEVLVQMYAYSGFPRCLNGLGTFTALLEERKAQGIRDEIGREATPIPADTDVRARGKAIQTQVSGREVKGGVFDFAPVVNEYLQAHLFGDIFLRDLLTFEDREIATVAALAGLGVEPQLRSHLNAALNVGVTEAQLKQLVRVLGDKVGAEAAERAGRLLEAVLEARKGKK